MEEISDNLGFSFTLSKESKSKTQRIQFWFWIFKEEIIPKQKLKNQFRASEFPRIISRIFSFPPNKKRINSR